MLTKFHEVAMHGVVRKWVRNTDKHTNKQSEIDFYSIFLAKVITKKKKKVIMILILIMILISLEAYTVKTEVASSLIVLTV